MTKRRALFADVHIVSEKSSLVKYATKLLGHAVPRPLWTTRRNHVKLIVNEGWAKIRCSFQTQKLIFVLQLSFQRIMPHGRTARHVEMFCDSELRSRLPCASCKLTPDWKESPMALSHHIGCVASHMCASARNVTIPTPPHQLRSI